jgi:6-phosphogluconolactonase
MIEPIVSRCADAEEAARRAAEVVAAALDAARTVRGAAHIALSGGSTVGRAYELLGPLLPDWRDVHLWYGDERCVPLDDDESNHRLASTRLEAPGAIWHPVPTQLGCDEAAAATRPSSPRSSSTSRSTAWAPTATPLRSSPAFRR